MYLARRFVAGQIHYTIRQTCDRDGYLVHRDLVDLGPSPGDYIIYPGGSSYYIDSEIIERLRQCGLEPDPFEVEKLFFSFLDPYIRDRITPFMDRQSHRRWKPMDRELRQRAVQETHEFDRRRQHFLRFGQTDQRELNRSPALFRVLLDKSRDELEQYFIEQEQSLKPHEYKRYVFTIFNLQRFFRTTVSRSHPEALDEEQLDRFFLEEVCRLDRDADFWLGIARHAGLAPYLVRYVVMYFDYGFPGHHSWDDFARRFIGSGRRRPAGGPVSMSVSEAGSVFGISRKELATMDRKALTSLYRKKAHELHPDKGGDHDRFIELTNAYRELLKGRR
ncbi:J domain-containing protein [Desulfolithobacter sp.]